MAVKKLDSSLPDSRKEVALRNDPTRVDPHKLKLGKQVARHDPRTRVDCHASVREASRCRVDRAWARGQMEARAVVQIRPGGARGERLRPGSTPEPVLGGMLPLIPITADPR